MADITEVQVFIDDDYKCTLQDLRNLRDRICSEDVCSIELISGADLVRQIANRVQELYAEIRELQVYKEAMESMASQMIHPKMTAKEMAQIQLGKLT
jgi:RNA polymerase-interacting CarD/CdnL/TRCF family regulator